MFFLRNLLFLTSLAFVTWVVLCFLDHIKEHREMPHRLNLAESLDNSLGDMVKCETKPYSEYHAYINFFCILAGAFALGKLIELVEIYYAPNIRSTFERLRHAKCNAEAEAGAPNGCTAEHNAQNEGAYLNLALDMHEATFTMDDYRDMTMSMRKEIGKIWKRNKYLDHRVGELEQQNLLLMGKGLLQAREPGVCFLNATGTVGGCDGETIVGCSGNIDPTIYPYYYFIDGDNCNAGISVGCSNFVCSYFCQNGFGRSTGGADGDKHEQGLPNCSSSSSSSSQAVRIAPKWVHWFPLQQNIFVGNRFYYLNREMGNNNNNNDNGSGSGLRVWQKYLKMHFLNYGMPLDDFEPLSSTGKSFPALAVAEKKIETRNFLKKMDFSTTEIDFSPEITSVGVGESCAADIKINAKKGLCNPMPIVVTTEELETIQGLGHPKKAVLSG